MKPPSKRIGELEILASLDHQDRAYSSQEDIHLLLELRNLSDSRLVVPYLLDHPAAFKLKDKDRSLERSVDYVPPSAPGTPAPEPHPEGILEPKESLTYRILLQFPLGFFAAGEYSLQYGFNFPGINFTSDWLDFSVLPLQVGGRNLNPSSAGTGERLLLAWSDLAAKPARILFQRSYIGEQKPLVPRTFVVGEGDSPGNPVPSMGPPDQDPLTSWVGWLSKDALSLARITGNDTVKTRFFPLPSKSSWHLVSALCYSEGPQGRDPDLAGILIGRDEGGTFLQGFRLASSLGPAWTTVLTLAGGDILDAKLLPLNADSRVCIWVRREGKGIMLECLNWEHGKPFGPVRTLASLPPSAPYKAFDATVTGLGIRWGVLLHHADTGAHAGTIRYMTHEYDWKERKSGAGIPRSMDFTGRPGPLGIGLRYDGNGNPWILQRDVHGPWLQTPEWDEAIAVESPRGSGWEDVFYRNRTVPKIHLLDPDTGFKTLDVPSIQEEIEEEDVLEDAEP